jgi:hypothetical protein
LLFDAAPPADGLRKKLVELNSSVAASAQEVALSNEELGGEGDEGGTEVLWEKYVEKRGKWRRKEDRGRIIYLRNDTHFQMHLFLKIS